MNRTVNDNNAIDKRETVVTFGCWVVLMEIKVGYRGGHNLCTLNAWLGKLSRPKSVSTKPSPFFIFAAMSR